MDYISTAQAAEIWGISERCVQRCCEGGRIKGVIKFSRVWAMPKDAPKLTEPRKKLSVKAKPQTNEQGGKIIYADVNYY